MARRVVADESFLLGRSEAPTIDVPWSIAELSCIRKACFVNKGKGG
jgi:hypothetical protein